MAHASVALAARAQDLHDDEALLTEIPPASGTHLEDIAIFEPSNDSVVAPELPQMRGHKRWLAAAALAAACFGTALVIATLLPSVPSAVRIAGAASNAGPASIQRR